MFISVEAVSLLPCSLGICSEVWNPNYEKVFPEMMEMLTMELLSLTGEVLNLGCEVWL